MSNNRISPLFPNGVSEINNNRVQPRRNANRVSPLFPNATSNDTQSTDTTDSDSDSISSGEINRRNYFQRQPNLFRQALTSSAASSERGAILSGIPQGKFPSEATPISAGGGSRFCRRSRRRQRSVGRRRRRNRTRRHRRH